MHMLVYGYEGGGVVVVVSEMVVVGVELAVVVVVIVAYLCFIFRTKCMYVSECVSV